MGPLPLLLSLLLSSAHADANRVVDVRDNQLFVDGVAQPQLYGAELQYFRLRGGQGKNIPRRKVVELWARALDRMAEARMNAISFYIPWDFHEYAEGRFDFDGTADEDGDGNADYPSRDLFTFFKMIEERGLRRIMVRPGPYINAEWGFLGFGAIPLWFHEKFLDSHMRNPAGLRTKLYDYHSPELLEYTRRWFSELHRQVLHRYLGPGKPILFLQIDNETNFMWQSIFNHDYGVRAVERYQAFLKLGYLELKALNSAHGTNWRSWEEIRPPSIPGVNVAEDREWYRFQDQSIHSYLTQIRQLWEEIGVKEPTVLFTLAESYNALGHGLLPHFELRNDAGRTGMMTVNLYPKTYETSSKPLMNLPFKADHDVIAMDEASDHYLGSRQEWLLGPEIQGGWWKGIEVSEASRRQTYLSTLGHGLKALFVYYFTEGDNWQSEWAKKRIQPFFDELRSLPEYAALPTGSLPEKFWRELQGQVDQRVLVGFDARKILAEDPHEIATLFFDAPLDADARPRGHYSLVRDLGMRVIAPYSRFLSNAIEVSDPVTLVKHTEDHAPSGTPGVDPLLMGAEWSGGLVGYLLQAGVNPRIFHWGLGDSGRLSKSRVLVRQDAGDAGSTRPDAVRFFRGFMESGGTVINFLGDSLARDLGLGRASAASPQAGPALARSWISSGTFEVAGKPLFFYEVGATGDACKPLLSVQTRVLGYRCRVGQGTFVQIGGLFHDAFNSDHYADLKDVPARRDFLRALLEDAGVQSQVSVVGGSDRVVAFARRAGRGEGLWVTVKSGLKTPVRASIRVDSALLSEALGPALNISVKALLTGATQGISPDRITAHGLEIQLPANGSEVYFLAAAEAR
jgi:hypothetical protein